MGVMWLHEGMGARKSDSHSNRLQQRIDSTNACMQRVCAWWTHVRIMAELGADSGAVWMWIACLCSAALMTRIDVPPPSSLARLSLGGRFFSVSCITAVVYTCLRIYPPMLATLITVKCVGEHAHTTYNNTTQHNRAQHNTHTHHIRS